MIKYPNKKASYERDKVSVKRRGMTFEALIDESNTFYLNQGIAVIHKKPTPIQVVHVDYPKRQLAKITEAYYKTPSTTDYNGVYKGYYIDFDVKESINKTSFPVRNIHAHQYEHLKHVNRQGGIAFLLIHFKSQNTMHLLPFKKLEWFYERSLKGRKSIAYEELCEASYLIKEGYRPTIDYLKAVDAYLMDQTTEK
jgi:recombination protein U